MAGALSRLDGFTSRLSLAASRVYSRKTQCRQGRAPAQRGGGERGVAAGNSRACNRSQRHPRYRRRSPQTPRIGQNMAAAAAATASATAAAARGGRSGKKVKRKTRFRRRRCCRLIRQRRPRQWVPLLLPQLRLLNTVAAEALAQRPPLCRPALVDKDEEEGGGRRSGRNASGGEASGQGCCSRFERRATTATMTERTAVMMISELSELTAMRLWSYKTEIIVLLHPFPLRRHRAVLLPGRSEGSTHIARRLCGRSSGGSTARVPPMVAVLQEEGRKKKEARRTRGVKGVKAGRRGGGRRGVLVARSGGA